MFLGSVITAQLAWDISDTFNGLMMVPNLIGLLILCPMVMKTTKNYVDRKIRHMEVKPILSIWPEIQEMQEKAIQNAVSEEDAE